MNQAISQTMQKYKRTGRIEIQPETYDLLHNYELELRKILKTSGLQMKMKESAENALIWNVNTVKNGLWQDTKRENTRRKNMQKVTDLAYSMHPNLIKNLDTICYNLGKDFDFVGIITGKGMVRVGKSVIAQQIGYYVAHEMNTPFTLKNVVFSGKELIKIAHEIPKNSVLIYDEAREGTSNLRTMENMSKLLGDFFAECGMYNHFIILVMPNYLDLSKTLAVSRSEFLIDCRRYPRKKILKNNKEVIEFLRGYFDFFGRKEKHTIYIEGKKNNENYNSEKHRNFDGTFPKFWVLDKEEYDKKKAAFVKRDREKKENKDQIKYRIALKTLSNITSQREAAKLLKENGLKISQSRINQIINKGGGQE